jgi:hypothetical protein
MGFLDWAGKAWDTVWGNIKERTTRGPLTKPEEVAGMQNPFYKEAPEPTGYKAVEDKVEAEMELFQQERQEFEEDAQSYSFLVDKINKGESPEPEGIAWFEEAAHKYQILPDGQEELSFDPQTINVLGDRLKEEQTKYTNPENRFRLSLKVGDDEQKESIIEKSRPLFQISEANIPGEEKTPGFIKLVSDEMINDIEKAVTTEASSNDGNLSAEQEENINNFIDSSLGIMESLSQVPQEEIDSIIASGGSSSDVYEFIADNYNPEIRDYIEQRQKVVSSFSDNSIGNAVSNFIDRRTRPGYQYAERYTGEERNSEQAKRGIPEAAFLKNRKVKRAKTEEEARKIIFEEGDIDVINANGYDPVNDIVGSYRKILNKDEGLLTKSRDFGLSTFGFLNKHSSEIISIGAEFGTGRAIATVPARVTSAYNKTKTIRKLQEYAAVSPTTIKTLNTAGRGGVILTDGILINETFQQANGDSQGITAEDLMINGAFNAAAMYGFKLGAKLFKKDTDTVAESVFHSLKKTDYEDETLRAFTESQQNTLKTIFEKGTRKGMKAVDIEKEIVKKIDSYMSRSVKAKIASKINIMEKIKDRTHKIEYMRTAIRMGDLNGTEYREAQSFLEGMKDTGSVAADDALEELFDNTISTMKQDIKDIASGEVPFNVMENYKQSIVERAADMNKRAYDGMLALSDIVVRQTDNVKKFFKDFSKVRSVKRANELISIMKKLMPEEGAKLERIMNTAIKKNKSSKSILKAFKEKAVTRLERNAKRADKIQEQTLQATRNSEPPVMRESDYSELTYEESFESILGISKKQAIEDGFFANEDMFDDVIKQWDQKQFGEILEVIQKTLPDNSTESIVRFLKTIKETNMTTWERGVNAKVKKNFVAPPGTWGFRELTRGATGEYVKSGSTFFHSSAAITKADEAIEALKTFDSKDPTLIKQAEEKSPFGMKILSDLKSKAITKGEVEERIFQLKNNGARLEGEINLDINPTVLADQFSKRGDTLVNILQEISDRSFGSMKALYAKQAEDMRGIMKDADALMKSDNPISEVEAIADWKVNIEEGLSGAEDFLSNGSRFSGSGNEPPVRKAINRILDEKAERADNLPDILKGIIDVIEGDAVFVPKFSAEMIKEYSSHGKAIVENMMKEGKSVKEITDTISGVAKNIRYLATVEKAIVKHANDVQPNYVMDAAERSIGKGLDKFIADSIRQSRTGIFGIQWKWANVLNTRTGQMILDMPLTQRFARKFHDMSKGIDEWTRNNGSFARAVKDLEKSNLVGELTDKDEILDMIRAEEKIIAESADKTDIAKRVFDTPYVRNKSARDIAVRSVAQKLRIKEGRKEVTRTDQLSDYFSGLLKIEDIAKKRGELNSTKHFKATAGKNDKWYRSGLKDEWREGIIGFKRSANEMAMNEHIATGIGKNRVRGAQALEEIFGYNGKKITEDILLKAPSLFKLTLNKLGGPIAGLFSKWNMFKMAIQDSTQFVGRVHAIENQLYAAEGISAAKEADALKKLIKTGGGRSLPVIDMKGKVIIDDAISEALREIDKVFSSQEEVFKLFSRDGATIEKFKKAAANAYTNIKGISLKRALKEVSSQADVMNLTNNYFAKKLNDLFVLEEISKTLYKTPTKLLAAVNAGDEMAMKMYKDISEGALERARISVSHAVGVDIGNPLMQSNFLKHGYAIAFFGSWASRMIGSLSHGIVDPLGRATRHVLTGDLDTAARIMNKTFENKEFRSLLGGAINAMRFHYYAQNIEDTNESANTWWSTVGQSTLLLGPMLSPTTKALFSGVVAYAHYDDLPPIVKNTMPAETKLQSAILEATSNLSASFLGQIRPYIRSVGSGLSYFSKLEKEDGASTTEYIMDGIIGALKDGVFSSVSRDNLNAPGGDVLATPTERLLASPLTNAIADIYMTPEVNRHYVKMQTLHSLYYAIGNEGVDQSLLPAMVDTVIRSSFIGDFWKLGLKGTPKRELNKRIKESLETAPVKMIIEDPVAAIEAGYIGEEGIDLIRTHVNAGKGPDEQRLFLAMANNMINSDAFQQKVGFSKEELDESLEALYGSKFLKKRDKILAEQRLTAFNDLLGGGISAAQWYFWNQKKETAKEIRDAGGTTKEEEQAVLKTLLSFPNILTGDTVENDTEYVEYLLNSDKDLGAKLIANYVARNIGWRDAKDKKGESVKGLVPFKATQLLAMASFKDDPVFESAFLNTTAGIFSKVDIKNDPEKTNQAAAVILGITNEVQESGAPTAIKSEAIQGMFYGLFDKFDKILGSALGGMVDLLNHENIVKLAKFIYDNTDTPFPITSIEEGGGGKKASKIAMLKPKAEKVLDKVRDKNGQLPKYVKDSYSPQSNDSRRYPEQRVPLKLSELGSIGYKPKELQFTRPNTFQADIKAFIPKPGEQQIKIRTLKTRSSKEKFYKERK